MYGVHRPLKGFLVLLFAPASVSALGVVGSGVLPWKKHIREELQRWEMRVNDEKNRWEKETKSGWVSFEDRQRWLQHYQKIADPSGTTMLDALSTVVYDLVDPKEKDAVSKFDNIVEARGKKTLATVLQDKASKFDNIVEARGKLDERFPVVARWLETQMGVDEVDGGCGGSAGFGGDSDDEWGVAVDSSIKPTDLVGELFLPMDKYPDLLQEKNKHDQIFVVAAKDANPTAEVAPCEINAFLRLKLEDETLTKLAQLLAQLSPRGPEEGLLRWERADKETPFQRFPNNSQQMSAHTTKENVHIVQKL